MYVKYVPKSNAPNPIDWIAVRAEYELGGISLRQLAERLGVSLKTVARRSSKESWVLGVRKVSADVSTNVSIEVSTRVRENVVNQKVEKVLNILSEIDRGIWECIDGMANYEFKSKEGAINGLDKLVRLRLELSDEYIDERLFKRGMVSVPIATIASELSQSTEETESDSESKI